MVFTVSKTHLILLNGPFLYMSYNKYPNYFLTFGCTHVHFEGPLKPLLWTSGDISSRVQSLSGQPYSHFAEAYVMYIPLWCDTANLMISSMVVSCFTHIHISGKVEC